MVSSRYEVSTLIIISAKIKNNTIYSTLIFIILEIRSIEIMNLKKKLYKVKDIENIKRNRIRVTKAKRIS